MIVGATGQESNIRNSTELILMLFYLHVMQVLFIRKPSQGGTHCSQIVWWNSQPGKPCESQNNWTGGWEPHQNIRISIPKSGWRARSGRNSWSCLKVLPTPFLIPWAPLRATQHQLCKHSHWARIAAAQAPKKSRFPVKIHSEQLVVTTELEPKCSYRQVTRIYGCFLWPQTPGKQALEPLWSV